MSFLRRALAPKSTTATDAWSPSNFLGVGGYGRKTTSGEMVTPASALTLATWFACIRNISEDVGKLPCELFEKQSGGGKKRALSHPVYSLVHVVPNRESVAMTFRETITGWALSWGNGYAEIERDGGGQPIALWPIHPSRVRVMRVDGEIVYDVWSPEHRSGVAVRLAAADVLHIRGFGDDPLCGLSVARLAAESLGLSLAAQTFGAAFFGNGATLGLVLEHPGVLGEQAMVSLRESWSKLHSGADNAHKVAVLEEGMKANTVSVPPEDAQFLETREFQDADIAKWFRMPLHKVQQMKAATFGNIEHQAIEYVSDCMHPWLTRWEQELARKLLDPRDVGRFVFEHLIVLLMRGDSAARANYYRTMISTGVLTPNEAREMESLNPIDRQIGDRLYMQGAMSTLDRIVAGPPPKPAPGASAPQQGADDGDGKDAEDQSDAEKDAKQQAALMMPVFADAEARCRRKEEMAIANAMRKHKTRAEFAPWATAFYRDHAAYLSEAMAPAALALSNTLMSSLPGYVTPQSALDQCVRDYCANALQHVAATGTPFTPDKPLAETVIAILTIEVAHA